MSSEVSDAESSFIITDCWWVYIIKVTEITNRGKDTMGIQQSLCSDSEQGSPFRNIKIPK
jgi:hypothetical protein